MDSAPVVSPALRAEAWDAARQASAAALERTAMRRRVLNDSSMQPADATAATAVARWALFARARKPFFAASAHLRSTQEHTRASKRPTRGELYAQGDCALERYDWSVAQLLWRGAERFCRNERKQRVAFVRQGADAYAPNERRGHALFHLACCFEQESCAMLSDRYANDLLEQAVGFAPSHVPLLVLRAAGMYILRDHLGSDAMLERAFAGGFGLGLRRLCAPAHETLWQSRARLWGAAASWWPDRAAVRFCWASSLWHAGQLILGVEHMLELAWDWPRLPLPHAYLGRIFRSQGMWEQAAQAWRIAVALAPQQAQGWEHLVVSELGCNRIGEASAAKLGMIAAQGDEFRKHLLLGRNLARERGRLFLQWGRTSLVEAFTAAKDDAQLQHMALCALGQVHHRLGMVSAAVVNFEQAAALDVEPSVGAAGEQESYAAALQASGRLDDALVVLESALERRGDHEKLLFRAGLVLQHLRRFDEAVVRWDELLHLQPEHVAAQVYRAQALAERKERERGIALLKDMLDAYPNEPLVPCVLGELYRQAKEYHRAYRLLRGAIYLWPHQVPMAYASLCALHNDAQELVRAQSVVQEGLRDAPPSAELCYQRGRTFALLGSRKQARQWFLLATRKDMHHLAAWKDLFVLAQSDAEPRPPTGIQCLLQIMRLSPDDPLLATVLAQRG